MTYPNELMKAAKFLCDEKNAEIERLRAALEFYADSRRYEGGNQRPIQTDPHQPPDCPYLWDVTRDRGKIAEAALRRGDRAC